MTKEQYKQAGDIVQKISPLKAELELVNHMIDNISGTVPVKIRSQWVINLPSQALRGHAQSRKVQLEQELTDLETQLANI